MAKYIFPDKLKQSPANEKMTRWILNADFRMLKRGRRFLTVPKGFDHDFASIPKVFHIILPPTGRYGKAAIVHDYLYKTGKFDRKKADKIFLQAMEDCNVPLWKRRTMYRAVRAFGWKAYNSYRK